ACLRAHGPAAYGRSDTDPCSRVSPARPRSRVDVGLRGPVDDLQRGLTGGELLDHLTRFVVGELHRRTLHEVRAGADHRAAETSILGQLRAPQRVDDDPGGVRGVPDLELHLDRQRDVAEVATLQADHRPLAVLEPRHVVARADVDVLFGERLGESGAAGRGPGV